MRIKIFEEYYSKKYFANNVKYSSLFRWKEIIKHIDIGYSNILPFTREEEELITKSFYHSRLWDSISIRKFDRNFLQKYDSKTEIIIINTDYNNNYHFIKLPDDWYVVLHECYPGSNTEYKCDEIEGVLQLIKDIKEGVI